VKSISAFVKRMQESLDRITRAKTDDERQAAEREMAQTIRENHRQQQPVSDWKSRAAGAGGED